MRGQVKINFLSHFNGFFCQYLGMKRQGQVKARGNGLFDASYYLDAEGPCKVEVYFAGRPVAGRQV